MNRSTRCAPPAKTEGIPLVVMLSAVTLLPGGAVGQTDLTYENWAEGFFTQNCCLCHHSSQSGLFRFGAPGSINFDSIELIRENEARIRSSVLGADQRMPPNGVLWWWDRENLAEWLDAGMPGEGDSLTPVEVDRNRTSLYYQSASLYFSGPIEGFFNFRYMRFRPMSDDDDQVPPEHRLFVNRETDGTVVLLAQQWRDDLDATRRVEYSPGIPILLDGGESTGASWAESVHVTERFWSGWTGGEPDSEEIRTEDWSSTNVGEETIDNGIILPVTAFKTTQSNLTADVDYSWWFAKGLGVVRREVDRPSTEYDREVTIEYNVIDSDRPLYDPPTIKAASDEWFPFVGPYHSSEGSDYDYGYQFDVQHVGITDGSIPPEATPTQLPLEPEPTFTPLRPTPKYTPVRGGDSCPNPVFNYSPDDPRASDITQDDVIDGQDLLLLLRHWHSTVRR